MSLRKIVQREGDRKRFPKPKSRVTISYKSWFHDPSKADAQYRGAEVGRPLSRVTIELGAGVLIAACEAEILKMSVGESMFLIVPESKAYGKTGIPNIVPPATDLVILLELLGIEGR